MNYIFVITILFSFTLMSACSTSSQRISGLPLEGEKKAQQQAELQIAQNFFESENFQRALEHFQKFKVKYDSSPFYQKAQLGEAKSLEQLGRWSEAVKIYRDMAEHTRLSQPEIAAESLYNLSYCYEALGEEPKVLSSLSDALTLRAHLPVHVATAEIPARLAASHYRMSRFEEAKKLLEQAEKGIQLLVEKDKTWVAKTYFQMGYLSVNQLSLDNFQANIDTLKVVQRFSLRSVEAGDEKWSEKSKEHIKNTYRSFTYMINQISPSRSLDAGAANRELIERKSKMADEILSSINLLRLARLPTENENKFVDETFGFIDNIEQQLVVFLNSRGDINELTPESERRRILNRKNR